MSCFVAPPGIIISHDKSNVEKPFKVRYSLSWDREYDATGVLITRVTERKLDVSKKREDVQETDIWNNVVTTCSFLFFYFHYSLLK